VLDHCALTIISSEQPLLQLSRIKLEPIECLLSRLFVLSLFYLDASIRSHRKVMAGSRVNSNLASDVFISIENILNLIYPRRFERKIVVTNSDRKRLFDFLDLVRNCKMTGMGDESGIDQRFSASHSFTIG